VAGKFIQGTATVIYTGRCTKYFTTTTTTIGSVSTTGRQYYFTISSK